MGMTIDEAIKQLETYTIPCGKYKVAYDLAVETMCKYQQLQANYETRLKADMVDMLEQLDSEIQEQIAFMGDGEETNGMKRADNLVKDKINALKQSIWQDNYNGKKEWLDGTYEKTSN